MKDESATVDGLGGSRVKTSEVLAHPIRLGLFLFASLIIVFELGLTQSPSWRIAAITWWELIALLNTGVFSWLYFRDVWIHAKSGGINPGQPLIIVIIGWMMNTIIIIAAAVLCFLSEWSRGMDKQSDDMEASYKIYIFLLALSFLIFSISDYLFARHATVPQKIREYWILFLFVDSPAAIGFTLILLYALMMGFSRVAISRNILSGAIVMQMLIADALYLLVASNFHNWYLLERLPSKVHLRDT